MIDITAADLTGDWKTETGVKIAITGLETIPEQKLWVGITSEGKRCFFTPEGNPVYFNTEIGRLMERQRGAEGS